MALWKRGKTWWADVTVNGQRYRESLKTADKREARRNHRPSRVRELGGGKGRAEQCGGTSALPARRLRTKTRQP